MIKPQTLKGFRDFLPEEALKRKWLIEKVSEIFQLWGYDPLETPILEPLEIFEGQIGEGEKMFYKFKDPGERNVALRYDQSVPISRLVGQYVHQLPFPFRRYQIQPVFRAEKPQKGRYREFLQCDADIFGVKSPIADGEVIALSLDIYKRLGFKKAVVLINDRALLKNIPYEAITSIDKLKKIGEDNVLKEMETKGILLNKAKEYLAYVKKLQPNETINIILNYLEKQKFSKEWYAFEPTLARSFTYSSGPIWEVTIPEYIGGSVLGGERFDNLIEAITGISIPATGFGMGFDRTLEAAGQLNLVPKLKTISQLLVTIFNLQFLDASLQLATSIRSLGINVELYPNPEVKLDKQLKYADKKGIPYVAIIGPNEVKNNTVTLKNLTTGTQQNIPRKDLPDVLKQA